MNKIWQYRDKVNEKEIIKIQEKFKTNRVLAEILVNRGITKENADVFLNPTRHDFHNPYEMPDMEKAVNRIIYAIENKEKVLIYGDYDVDGITSTTILKQFLNERGLDVGTYIPNRLEEGYGLNCDAIEKISKDNYKLIITVDCGITGIEEVKLAKQNGLDVIITDHHEPGENLPNAIAVVDCKRKDNKYIFKELAGVGVTFKLIQAICIALNLKEEEYLKYLDIVAIGTISDIVPLVDENRVITFLGLKLVRCTKNIGLQAILNETGYSKIDSTAIAFGVAPRINACGRMGLEKKALDLLLEKNKDNATILAKEINSYNNQRQLEEKKIFEEANAKIKINKLENEDAIVLGGRNWHTGVIGIVSSKITENYYKPSILISFKDDEEIGKGSGRSIEGLDLHLSLTKCKELLNSFGGHSMAVGLSVSKNNFEEFKELFLKIVKESDVSEKVPIIQIESIINIDEINMEIVKSISLLEPFGEANKMPIFAFKNLKIDSIRSLSEGKHLKLSLKSNKNTYINAIGFNLGEYAEEYKIGDKVDVAGNLEINAFNGMESIQINIKDLKRAV